MGNVNLSHVTDKNIVVWMTPADWWSVKKLYVLSGDSGQRYSEASAFCYVFYIKLHAF